MVEYEDFLLALLNSAPVVDGKKVEEMEGPAGSEFARRFGGTGSSDETANLRRTRDALHEVIREQADPDATLGPLLVGAVLTPEVTPTGIRWELDTSADVRLAVRAVMAWSDVVATLPGRLRACANSECNLFLVDHSRPGSAKWCSMSTCGNRIKARNHASRHRKA